jgi:hypothetical protein
VEEDIDPMLDPVLEKQLVYKGRKITVCVSDKVMEYDPNFRMYFITRYAHKHCEACELGPSGGRPCTGNRTHEQSPGVSFPMLPTKLLDLSKADLVLWKLTVGLVLESLRLPNLVLFRL